MLSRSSEKSWSSSAAGAGRQPCIAQRLATVTWPPAQATPARQARAPPRTTPPQPPLEEAAGGAGRQPCIAQRLTAVTWPQAQPTPARQGRAPTPTTPFK